MREPVHFIPIVTTVIAVLFGAAVLHRWRARGGLHLLWWAIGLFAYGAGTLTEATVTLVGWHEGVFRAWYITGALLGGAPLAQGTVYLLLSRRTADRLTLLLVPVIGVAALCVLAAPIDYAAVEPYQLTGRVLDWRWVRAFSPFINLYAFVFLAGGAALSAERSARQAGQRHRVVGNTLIAVGALLPGIGGSATRFGHTEVLYVTELVGLLLILAGYRRIVRGPGAAADTAVTTAARGVVTV
ncbi:MAG: hypothetical protein OER21_15130 [Gemmatimonadota bacterium]|nr:hypothetical protein [Gemmatimonadota bacterium]